MTPLYQMGRDIGQLQMIQKQQDRRGMRHSKRLSLIELRQAIFWRVLVLLIGIVLTATGQLNREHITDIVAVVLSKWLLGS